MAEKNKCPHCNTPGATKFLWIVKCPNPRCRHYDTAVAQDAAAKAKPAATPPTGNFNPGANAIQIQYKNHQGQNKSFTGDRTTLRKRRQHITLVLAPAGKRCSFKIDRIANMAALTPFLPPEDRLPLSPGDRQVLTFHRKRGSTSPRYEELMRKAGQPVR